MVVPVRLPTAAREETYGGVTYHIEGELVPVLHIEQGRKRGERVRPSTSSDEGWGGYSR